MQQLLKGIALFQSEVFNNNSELFTELSKGQKPATLLITCSDSRICPNMMTQSQPGDLFVLRTAGNIIPAYGAVQGGEAATIEYAVGALKVQDIVVCGHSHCGAMAALLNPKSLDAFPSVKSYLRHAEATRQIVDIQHSELENSDPCKLSRTIEQNVLVQLSNLKTHPSVAAAMQSGQVRLHGWVYSIETGEINSYNLSTNEYESLIPRKFSVEPALAQELQAS